MIDDQHESIKTDAIASYDDIKVLAEKDISNLVTDFAGRTNASG